jgi:hypothetical protein
MNVRGAIYHNPQFPFHDGTVGNKLLILLNTPTGGEEYLFVKTTSQPKGRTRTPGCGTYYAHGEYFLPRGAACFPEDTWVLLYELYPIPPQQIDRNPAWRVLNVTLSGQTIEQIIDCLFTHHHEDIPEIYEAWLRPPLKASLFKLAEKFNRRS